MKNFKLYAILGLCFGILFLTACGGGNTPTLICSEGEKITIKIFYEEDEKTPKSAEVNLKREIPEGTSEDSIDLAKKQLETAYCSDKNLKCEVIKSGNYLVMNLSGDIEKMIDTGVLEVDEDDDLSLEGLKERAENNGAKCTKSYE